MTDTDVRPPGVFRRVAKQPGLLVLLGGLTTTALTLGVVMVIRSFRDSASTLLPWR